jgi:hypothetical protein
MVKFDTYGGDADIDYKGFLILDDNLLTIFNDFVENVNLGDYIHVDYADYLSVSLRGGKSYKDIFKIEEITEDEFKVLRKLFPVAAYKNPDSYISYGTVELWECLFDSDYAWETYFKDNDYLLYTKD